MLGKSKLKAEYKGLLNLRPSMNSLLCIVFTSSFAPLNELKEYTPSFVASINIFLLLV